MKADRNGTTLPKCEYFWWGEWLEGTKEQLQAVGLLLGDELKIKDPRGFSATIRNSVDREGSRCYDVRIRYPGRGRLEHERTPYAAGVERCDFAWWGDEYTGSGAALVAAGLVQREWLPGPTGPRKVSVTVGASGRIKTLGKPLTNIEDGAGSRQILKVGPDRYRVVVKLPDEAAKARREVHSKAEHEHEARMNALPRPAPLPGLTPCSPAEVVPPQAVQRHDATGLADAFLDAFELSPAHFNVGDEAIEWERQEIVKIIGPYSRYDVEGTGNRCGYLVRDADGGRYFVPAYELLEVKTNRVRHVRLVQPSGVRHGR